MIKCVAIFALGVLSCASPVPEPRSFIEPQQFIVLHPQASPQLSQLKYESPIIAPITQLGHISTPKEQLYFFYPSAPLADAPVVSFQRDDGGEFNLISFITNWFASKPAETQVPVVEAPPAPASPPPAAMILPIDQAAAAPVNRPAQDTPAEPPKQPEAAIPQPAPEEPVGEELRPVFDTPVKKDKIEINPDAEIVPQATPQPRPPQPAYAPFPLVPQIPDRRVYIVSGQPQFFGNFDAFANPLNPIFSLQPLTPIIARNNEETKIEALPEESSATEAQKEETVETPVSDLRTQPEVAVMETETPAQEQILADPSPSVDVFARANSRVEFLNTENGDVQAKELTDVEKRITDTINQDTSRTGGETRYSEPSVAQAAPSGLAIAGVGGVASSQPSATAVSGDGGISLASPKATSIAGDFFDFDEKKKLKIGGN